jgi:hypothetical protein
VHRPARPPRLGEGNGHPRLPGPGCHGKHHAALAVTQRVLDRRNGLLLVWTISVGDGMFALPQVRRAEIAPEEFPQLRGGVEESNLAGVSERVAQVGDVNQLTVSGVNEWQAVFAEAVWAALERADVAFGLLDDVLRTHLEPLGFHIRNRLAIKHEQVVARPGIGRELLDRICRSPVPGHPAGMADQPPAGRDKRPVDQPLAGFALAKRKRSFGHMREPRRSARAPRRTGGAIRNGRLITIPLLIWLRPANDLERWNARELRQLAWQSSPGQARMQPGGLPLDVSR